MTESERRMMEALGLSKADFLPKPRTEDRIDSIEKTTDELKANQDEMILLMADLIAGS